MYRLVMVALMACLVGTASAGAAESLAEVPYAITSDNLLTTDVIINGAGPFHMVIDTGCTRTTLFAHTASRLGLQPSGTSPVSVFTMSAKTTSLPYLLYDMRIGSEAITDLTVVVIEDPNDKLPTPDGIIGLDVLERYAIVFDHPNRQMLLFSREDGVPSPYKDWRRGRFMPTPLKQEPASFWSVQAEFSDLKALSLLDLGTGVTIIDWDLSRDLLPRARMPEQHDDKVRDALGKGFPAFRIEGVTVRLAGYYWINQDLLVADLPVLKLLGVVGQPISVIGAGLLKERSFALDFKNERLYVGRG